MLAVSTKFNGENAQSLLDFGGCDCSDGKCFVRGDATKDSLTRSFYLKIGVVLRTVDDVELWHPNLMTPGQIGP